MTEQQIAAMRQALEALETGTQHGVAIDVLRRALADNALDKKAENARKLGLDYEPVWNSGPTNKDYEDAMRAKGLLKLTAALEQPAQEDWKDRLIAQHEETILWQAKRIADLTEQPAQQEPVAWVGEISEEAELMLEKPRFRAVPLYTRPQAREPVIDKSAAKRIATALGWEPKREPLTDEEIEQCMKQAYATVQGRNLEHAFARAIEAAHGITGEKK